MSGGPPVNVLPPSQATNLDTQLTLAGGTVSITDPDVGGATIQVTLTATNGHITLGHLAGLTFSTGTGTYDTIVTFTAPVATINADLNGLVFFPTGGYSGAAGITIQTNDLGNSGSGSPQIDMDTLAVTVNNGPVSTPSVPTALAREEQQRFAYPGDVGRQRRQRGRLRIQAASLNWGPWTTIGTVGPNVTSYVHSGLSAGASYQYRVRAINSTGDSDWTAGNPVCAAASMLRDPAQVIHAPAYQEAGGSFYNYNDGISASSDGSWFKYGSFDLTAHPIASFSAVSAGTGRNSMEIRLDSPTGTLLGTLALGGNGDYNAYQNATTTLAAATGTHDIYIVYRDAGGSNNIRTISFGPNHAPVNTVPAAQLVSQGGNLVFSSANSNVVSVDDADQDGNPLKVTIAVTHGTLTLSQVLGLSFSSGTGAGNAAMTASFAANRPPVNTVPSMQAMIVNEHACRVCWQR